MKPVDLKNRVVAKAIEAVGLPYWYGDATCPQTLKTPWLNDCKGYDCSGLAQGLLREAGILRSDAWHDKTAHDLSRACDSTAAPVPGDLCFYGTVGKITHVTVYLGEGMCIGANGGTSTTRGNDERARVQIVPAKYRKDFLHFGTIKKEFRA